MANNSFLSSPSEQSDASSVDFLFNSDHDDNEFIQICCSLIMDQDFTDSKWFGKERQQPGKNIAVNQLERADAVSLPDQPNNKPK